MPRLRIQEEYGVGMTRMDQGAFGDVPRREDAPAFSVCRMSRAIRLLRALAGVRYGEWKRRRISEQFP